MAMNAVFDAHFKAKFSRSTLAYLLPSKIYVVWTVPCIDVCGLLLTSSSNLLLLISFNMLFKLPVISSRFSMMNTMKIEPGAFLVHTTTFLHNSETLGESKALQTLTAKLYIVKYLTISRLFQKSRGEGSNASFNLIAEVGRAVGMGSPSGRRGGHGNSKTPRIPIA